MTLIIFLDTNALWRKNLALSDELRLISEHAKKYDIRLTISRVACLELENQGKRQVRYVKQFYSEWRDVFSRQMSTREEIFELADHSPEEYVYGPLRNMGVEIVENSADDIYIAVNAMYQGLRPSKKVKQLAILGNEHKKGKITPYDTNYVDFKYDENGIKDVFIWRSAVSMLNGNPENELALITDNKTDFCSDKNPRQIHVDLAADLEGESSERVVVFSDMEDFLEHHVGFIDNFNIYAAKMFEYSDFNVLAPDLTNDYSEYELIRAEKFSVAEVEGIYRFTAVINLVFKRVEDDGPTDRPAEEWEMVTLVRVSRKAEGTGADVYDVELVQAMDETVATGQGWTWPVEGDGRLEKLLALKLARATAEAAVAQSVRV